jgi:cell division protein FtsW
MAGIRSEAVRRHRPDLMIALFMMLLMLVGLVVIYAIGPQRANVLNNLFEAKYAMHYFFTNQLVSVGLSLVAFFVAYKVPFKFVRRSAFYLLLAGLVVCLILAISGAFGFSIAQCTYGACRWISLGSRSFQPSELLKIGLLLYLALNLGSMMAKGTINNLRSLKMPTIAVALALFFVVVLQKDLGTGVAIGGMVMSMLVISGMSKKILAVLVALALVLGLVLSLGVPHRRDRLITFLQGDESSIEDSGSYHITHAKIAIGTGGLLGVGIGNSVQATGYLPESINDSIFAIMGETFGFVGILAIITLFVTLLYRLLKNIYFLHEPTSRLIVAGVFGWLASHVIMNTAAMIGILPLTGITLPFLSYGGTSMMFMAAALGVVFHLSSYSSHTPVNEEKPHEGTSSRRRLGRARYTNLGRHNRTYQS